MDVVFIVNCSEIFIEQPKNLTAHAQTWPNYKDNNTAKYLIGITPSGAATFLFAGWGGRVSDKQISIDSRFFKMISIGECILADKRFTFKEKLSAVGATLKIPHFTKGKNYLSGKEVDTSHQLLNAKTHVESYW